jgi:CDP-diacylglycerol--serine O-phosphatidyltransferase
MLKRGIPNILTLGNLFVGCLALLTVMAGDIENVWKYSCICLLLDFADGFAARALKVQSLLGKQLDSLADLISFGLVPSMLVFQLWKADLSSGLALTHQGYAHIAWQAARPEYPVLALTAFFIVLASAVRLARFNIQEEDPGYFSGLSSPANTTLWVFLPPLIRECSEFHQLVPLMSNTIFLLLTTGLSAALLLLPVRFWSLKRLPGSLKEGLPLIAMGVIGLLGLSVYGLVAIPLLVLIYVMISLIFPPPVTS